MQGTIVTSVTANSCVFIFYTGDHGLLLSKNLPVKCFDLCSSSRPNLVEQEISGVVNDIVLGEGLPEDICNLFDNRPSPQILSCSF